MAIIFGFLEPFLSLGSMQNLSVFCRARLFRLTACRRSQRCPASITTFPLEVLIGAPALTHQPGGCEFAFRIANASVHKVVGLYSLDALDGRLWHKWELLLSWC